MKKKLSNIIICLVFIVTISYFAIPTFWEIRYEFFNLVGATSIGTSKFEDLHKSNFYKKNDIVDIFGIIQNILAKNIIGDLEYYRDDNKVMQAFDFRPEYTDFADEMLKLKDFAVEYNTPILYVQAPSKVIDGYTNVPKGFVNTQNSNMDKLIEVLEENEIPIFDYRQEINNGGFYGGDVFFKTDLHMTTEAELDMMDSLINILEMDFGLKFENKEQMLNINNYEVISKPFLGNYAFSSGKYFAGLDIFNMYIPKFETTYTLSDIIGNELRKGNFEDVIMNGYHDASSNERTYWVTNYLQFNNPAYQYENNKVNTNNILLVTDSLSMRMAAYLSLMCNNVTIIDPRVEGQDYNLQLAMQQKKYDVIIVAQGSYLTDTKLIKYNLKNPSAEIINTTTLTEVEKDKTYSFEITVKNTGDEAWSEERMVRLAIFPDGQDHGYRIAIPKRLEVKPNEEYTFVLNGFQPPPSESIYLEYQMVEEGITWFGDKKRVDISIK